MSKVTYPAIYAPVRYSLFLELHCLGSAGPRPNITGMRKKYWGDCPVVRCGQYAYRVSLDVYNTIKYGREVW